MGGDLETELARLPQLDALLKHAAAADAVKRYGRRTVAAALRDQLEAIRTSVRRGGDVPDDTVIVTAAVNGLQSRRSGRLTRVINATGVVLHTNLGRAPLSASARAAVQAAAGYTTVEYDLEAGRRGSRTASLGELAAEVAGTPAATVVNNGAAALVLALAALAHDRETVVSRGELVEIGGSYRLPEIMAAAGSTLVEVGTTNRTHVGDYAAVIGENTGMLLKVHRSNFAMVGFTADTTIGELAGLGSEHGVPVVYDLGSGLVKEVRDGPLRDEPAVTSAVAAGANLVIFSGDKLLGGPQAGIIAGEAELVRRCTRHPLARAMRVDKLQRAALEATLESHLRADVPVDVPAVAMLHMDVELLAQRAMRLAESIGPPASTLQVDSVIGGGALPGVKIPSWAVVLPNDDPDELARRLRHGLTPVIARIEGDTVVFDLRTVAPSQDEELETLVRAAGS